MKILYVTDLDGTLISEQLNDKDENILALKTSHGESYITRQNLKRLKEVAKFADVMPLTTRSKGSFANFNIGMDFKYALIENGGCLIENGQFDEKWEDQSRVLLEQEKEKEMLCRKYLEAHGYKVKSNSKFVIDYINKETNMEETKKCFDDLVRLVGDSLEITIHNTGQIFAVHRAMRKGDNLKRFLQSHEYDLVITCGDGKADFGMLEGRESIGLTGSPAKYQFPMEKHKKSNHDFTEFALAKVLSLIQHV